MTWRMLAPFGSAGVTPSSDLFSSLQRELNRVFEDFPVHVPTSAAASGLRVDVKENDKAFLVTADLPGLCEKEVEVTFDDGVLTIRGEKKIEREEGGDTWHIVERSCGSFARHLRLPPNVEADKIAASVDKGVLTVTLPKLSDEKAGAKKIEVKKV